MDENTKYFISLLAAYIYGQDEPLQGKTADWEQVCRWGKIHSVSGIIYFMAKKQKELKPAAALLQTMKKDFTSTIARAAEQEMEMNTVIQQLSSAQIPHIIFKGYVIQNSYPVKELRTMGDIDIMIKRDDREKSHELLQKLGYEASQATGEVWHYSKGVVHLEIHTQLFSHNINNKFDYIEYFSKAWDHAVMKPNGYTYEFSVNYHFLYIIVHMAKHCYGYGCGIRMMMDVAAYLIQFDDELDRDYMNEELEKLGLALFAQHIFTLCQRWFDVCSPVKPLAIDEHLYEEFSDYILSAGTFGYYERNRLTSRLRKEYAVHNKTNEPSLFRLYLKIVFPGYAYMSKVPYCSFLKDRPFLLPAAWIRRICRGLLSRTAITPRSFVGITQGKKECKEQYELISKIGL